MRHLVLLLIAILFVLGSVTAQDPDPQPDPDPEPEESMVIYGLQMNISREMLNKVKSLTNITYDAYLFARFKIFNDLALADGCDLEETTSSLIQGPKEIEILTTQEKCTKLDFDKLVKEANETEITDELIDEVTEGIPRNIIKIPKKNVTIISIVQHVKREKYPLTCIDPFKNLLCFSKEQPECDLQCPPSTECDPAESIKYCTEFTGCREAIDGTYQCATSSSSGMAIVSAMIIAVASSLFLFF